MVPDRFWVLAAVLLSVLCGLELTLARPSSSGSTSPSAAAGDVRLRPLEPGARVPGFVSRSFGDGSEERVAFDGERKSLFFLLGENCDECKTNVPRWNAVARAAEGRALVVGLAIGRFQRIRWMLSEPGAEFPVLRFPSEDVLRAYGAFKFPQTLLVDEDGVVEKVLLGPLDEEQAEGLVEAAVEGALPRASGR